VILCIFLQVSHSKVSGTLRRQIIQLDPLGTAIFLAGVTCFLLALQWGGTKYPWNSGQIIALFVLAGVLGIAFVAVQIWRQDDATIPPRIIQQQRSITFGMIYALCVGGALISLVYAMPLWFQAVKGTTAVQSGIRTIPLVLALVAGAIISGGLTTKIGYYVPFMFVSAILMSVGCGLMTTFKVDTGHAKWIGYSVLSGFGLGAGMQPPNLAAQTVLEKKDVPMGVSLMFFCQSLGGAIFLCIGQSLFRNYLTSTLPGISGVDSGATLATGATELAKMVSPDKLSEVLVVYNDALRRSFQVALAVSCLLVLPALGMQWKSIKKADSSNPSKSAA